MRRLFSIPQATAAPAPDSRSRLAGILPAALAILPILILLAVMLPRPGTPVAELQTLKLDLNDPAVARRGLLLLPISSPYGDLGIALDGGELPFYGQQVPRMTLGNPGPDEPLRAAVTLDWTSPPCIELMKNLLSPTDSQPIPHTELFLLPVFTTPTGEAVHRLMMHIHLASSNVNTLPTIFTELSHGKLAADPAAIRARLAEIDPDLDARMFPDAEWLNEAADTAFALAQAQSARNAFLFQPLPIPQLATFDALLAGAVSADVLLEFLRESATRQTARLQTHPTVFDPGAVIRCECEDPAHRHALPMARDFQLQASPLDSSPDQDPEEIDDLHADQPANVTGGAQIRLNAPRQKAEPIRPGEAASVTYHFDNTGDQPLLIQGFQISCTCVTIHHESDTVAPGQSAFFTVIFDSAVRPGLPAGDQVEYIWIATNSLHKTDSQYGHQVEMVIPILTPE